MARMDIINGVTWEQARKEAAQSGIILTHRKHTKGGYVCYASKRLRESFKMLHQLRQLPHHLHGKIC